MDSDSTTPAALYFQDESFILAGTWREPEAILWLSFAESVQHVNLSVYGYGEQIYTHDFKGSTPEDAQAFFAEVESDYEVKLPSQYVETVSTFLSLKDKAFGLHASLDESSSHCDTCNDSNRSELEAFYFPPLNEGEDASLAVDWRFGCYNSEVLAGDVSDKDFVKKVRSVLRTAMEKTKLEAEVNQIQGFLNKLAEAASGRN